MARRLVVLIGALLLGACQAPAEPVASAAPTAVARIGLTEWTIETGEATLRPGTVRLLVTNTGATRHDLLVRGRAGVWRTPDLAPGERAELEIRAAAGERLTLVCTVAGHSSHGMRAWIDVAEDSDAP